MIQRITPPDFLRQLPATRPVVALVREDLSVHLPYVNVHTIGEFFNIPRWELQTPIAADAALRELPFLAEIAEREDSFVHVDSDFLNLPANRVLPHIQRRKPGALMRAYLGYWLPMDQWEAVGIRVDATRGDAAGYFTLAMESRHDMAVANRMARRRGIPLFFISAKSVADWLGVSELTEPTRPEREAVEALVREVNLLGHWYHHRSRSSSTDAHTLRTVLERTQRLCDAIRDNHRPVNIAHWARITCVALDRFTLETGSLSKPGLYHFAHAMAADGSGPST